MRRLYNIFIIFAMLFIIVCIGNRTVRADDTTSSQAYDASEYRDKTFYRTYQRYLANGKKVVNLDNPLTYSLEDSILSYTFAGVSMAKVIVSDYVDYIVNVSEEGLYEIGLTYYLDEEFSTNPEIDILVNNEYQYNEMMSLPLEVNWNVTPREEDERYNRFGNELLPFNNSSFEVYFNYLNDDNSMYDYNYKFLLNQGENIIRVIPNNLNLYLGDLKLYNQKEIISYSDYDLTKESNTKGYVYTIEGESFVSKNSLTIKPSYYNDANITPYAYKTTVLNILDASSSSDGGNRVDYNIKVEKTGYYNICFKYLHDTNLGVVASKNIYLNGEILYKELQGYNFSTARNWTNTYLKSNGNNLSIYLEANKDYTFSIESTTAYTSEIVDRLHAIMDWINSTGLNVKAITGGQTSSVITQNITKYLPTLEEDLKSYAKELLDIYEVLMNTDGGIKSSSPAVSCLNVAAKQLQTVAKKPNKINSKLNIFSDGSGSAYQLIGEAVTALSRSSMDIDKIYLVGVGSNVKLPRAESNIFQKIWYGILSFFYSFFDERYKLAETDGETLNVWVQQSNLYVDIMQSMVDQSDLDFNVKFSVLPSTSKIVLSSSTGDNPDVILSIDDWEPYSYALRGILEPLNNKDGFYDMASKITDGNFTPLIFEDGVYGIPETTSVYILYYRKDILNSLNIDIPDTWDDTLELLYTLQSYSMNFYHPMSMQSSYKSFGVVSPFIFQFNGEIFSEDSLTSTLEDDNTIKAIDFLTSLYTVYNLPQEVSSFFENFRTGTMPIGISTIDLYLQLQYAAPEIAGQWGYAVIPGIYDEGTDEVERWSPTYGKCSILFKNSKLKNEGWELIKWWNSTETQIEYLKNIRMTLGQKYAVIPANMDALANSIWEEDIAKVILEQERFSMTPAVTPGSYIVERELSQIWNKVVVDKMPVRQAISESIPRINRELKRKLDEFGYIYYDENGKVCSSYKVPISSNLGEWLRK